MSFERLLMALLALLVGCNRELAHDLTESSANKALLLLSRSGIVAEKRASRSGWSVLVPDDDFMHALEVVTSKRVIKEPRQQRTAAKSFIPSADERLSERELRAALSLEESLNVIPEVIDVRAIVSLKPDRERVSIVIVVEAGARLDRGLVVRLAAGSVGVREESVTTLVVEEREVTTRSYETISVITPRARVAAGLSLLTLFLLGIFGVARRWRGSGSGGE